MALATSGQRFARPLKPTLAPAIGRSARAIKLAARLRFEKSPGPAYLSARACARCVRVGCSCCGASVGVGVVRSSFRAYVPGFIWPSASSLFRVFLLRRPPLLPRFISVLASSVPGLAGCCRRSSGALCPRYQRRRKAGVQCRWAVSWLFCSDVR